MERLDTGAAIACTLNDAEFRERRALARRTVISKITGTTRTDNGLILTFEGTEGILSDLKHFISLEQQCCGFLDFVISDGSNIELTVSGPPEASATIDTFVATIKERA